MSRLLGLGTTEFLGPLHGQRRNDPAFGRRGPLRLRDGDGRLPGPSGSAARLPALSPGPGGRPGGRGALCRLPEAGGLRGRVRDGRDRRGFPGVAGRGPLHRLVGPLRPPLPPHDGPARAARHRGQDRGGGGRRGERARTDAAAGSSADASPLSSWQDIDASLAEYCAAKGLPVPAGIEAAIDLHLEAMTEWLDELERTNDELP
ncbi:MAG: hypothetical protein MZV70_70585 [Desulfobacterales bacterium]|nr:hypothetical protein [Desulfobacterales bacterium]